ncbi:hypothetical protein [uncultured Microbacterium sp.]|uniref:hypothetical protein n=1 Tax=uncultured Microbacterium sp. TaxID=191216 RepID=UPI00260464FE|nr:hypothetical protein [uncultured Microbacterium sp.]
MTGLATATGLATSAHRDRRLPLWRRCALFVAGLLLSLGTSLIAYVTAVSRTAAGDVTVLVGTLGAAQIVILASVACLTALAVGLCLIPVARPWLALLVPVRAVAVLAAFATSVPLMWSPWTTVTPLLVDGCETGYTVVERSFLLVGTGSVYRVDGVVATRVGTSVPDDGYHPFADGNYAVTSDGDALHIWYSAFNDQQVSTDSRDPDIVAQRVADPKLRCGIDSPTSPYRDRADETLVPQRDPEDDSGNPWFRDLP